MKKLSFVFFAFLMTAMAGSALASCPTGPNFYSGGGSYWVDWTQDVACYAVDSSITSETVGCYGAVGWRFNSSFVSTASTSFTPTSSQVYDPSKWWGSTHIEFTSPSGSANDFIALWAVVYHNGSPTSTNLFSWNGTNGNLSGCPERAGNFSAQAGDTIYIMVQAANGSGTATIRAGVPHITDSF